MFEQTPEEKSLVKRLKENPKRKVETEEEEEETSVCFS